MNILSRSLLTITLLSPPVHARAAQPPDCSPNQLSLSTDDENGNFNGLSHSGILVVLRNLGPSACRLQPMAQITFRDASGRDLGVKGLLPGARLMHPGPVVLPIILAAGAEATAALRWVSGPVFDGNTSISATTLRVTLGTTSLTTPLRVVLYGDATKGITFEQARFALDPVYSAPAVKPSVTR